MTIQELYDLMSSQMGQRSWLKIGDPWAESAWEIIWGGILVQNTNWRNVEPSLVKLKAQTRFNPAIIRGLDVDELIPLIRTSGFYTRKAQTLKNVADWIGHYQDDMTLIKSKPTDRLRKELLAIKGIGHETSDYILMYVLDKPAFIADNYVRKLFTRLGATVPKTYVPFAHLVDAQVQDRWTLTDYQEFHALIVDFGKVVKSEADWQTHFLAGHRLTL
ncbi:endonuclease III domain-containing protein [Levilactobacillus bambusae]|uniref:Endonuclease III n=1 Tax=Levilactobacillus bambusae TaxID=2024736 RepID=A0A2V1MYE6_9LACO|nr:endonuclease III [Levilactobacillus bambusae]PWF99792.1 endonuclease III [Levilactobacillus bambusae]